MNEMLWNTPDALHAWVDTTLDNIKPGPYGEMPSPLGIKNMRDVGHRMVSEGKLRGDISEAWKSMYPFLNGAMLDLYL
jgi:hypothetical protein